MKPNLLLKSQLKPLLIFALITFIAYLPFTSMLFALKNDAFTGYFPPKFFMSESLSSGHLPLWNPYINYGLPQYGDMSSAFWNPITWLFSSTVGYNAYTFTIEEALYIFLAGLGIFNLTKYWEISKNIRLISGVAYMTCGYFVGHLQHFNWIAGAAFFPWLLSSYLDFHKKTSLISFLKIGVSSLLFSSAAHPGLIIGSLYFLLPIAVMLVYKDIKKSDNKIFTAQKTCKKYILLFFAIVAFNAGTIISYTEILPFIERGSKLSLEGSLAEPTTLQSWISALLPFSIVKNDALYATDISMRNCYFSLLFLMTFLAGLTSKKSSWQKMLLGIFIFFFLLSMGSIFKQFAYSYVPLLGYVRLNGEFRIFAILPLILFSAIELNKIKKTWLLPRMKGIYWILSCTLVALLMYGLLNIYFSHKTFFFSNLITTKGSVVLLKDLVDKISYYDTLIFQSLIQLVVLNILYVRIKRNQTKLIIVVSIIEIMMTTLLNVPFTGVGKASTRDVQVLLDKSPAGIPLPMKNILRKDSLTKNEIKQIGDWSFYSKEIGPLEQIPYPINLKTTVHFYEKNSPEKISGIHFIYLQKEDSSTQVKLMQFTPTLIAANTSTPFDQVVTIKQNFYPKWECYVNQTKAPIKISQTTFMSVSLLKGNNQVLLMFKNPKIVLLIFWTLSLFVVSLIVILFKRKMAE